MAQIRTESISTTLWTLNNDFAGRHDDESFDDNKPLRIHRRNRANVWTPKMDSDLLDSILKGYYIPPIICAEKQVNSRRIREIMEGGNRMSAIRKFYRRQDLTPDQLRKIDSFSIQLVVISNLTPKDTREMFRRLNKCVKVSDGQLYDMSQDDSPLVQEALALLNDPDYPLRTRISDLFFDTKNADNARRQNLENAIALISGALYGPEYITKSFSRQESKIEDQSPIDRARVVTVLGHVFDIFRLANQQLLMINKTTLKSYFTIGKYLGPILYDIHTDSNLERIKNKWVRYLLKVRRNERDANDAIVITGAQNINPDKLKRMSVKVAVYIESNRIMHREELDAIRHPATDNDLVSDDESEEESVEEVELVAEVPVVPVVPVVTTPVVSRAVIAAAVPPPARGGGVSNFASKYTSTEIFDKRGITKLYLRKDGRFYNITIRSKLFYLEGDPDGYPSLNQLSVIGYYTKIKGNPNGTMNMWDHTYYEKPSGEKVLIRTLRDDETEE
jgi:hypothetical protein